MILLDTNVLSEAARTRPDARVAGWMATKPRRLLVTSAIVRAEILFGLSLLPEGRRKQTLVAVMATILGEIGRILPFDSMAASHYVEIARARRDAGRPLAAFDGLIAATALANGAILATRDVADFDGCGLTIVNPWDVPTAD